MKGLREIYSFTLRQILKTGTVRVVTIVMAAILFLAPLLITGLSMNGSGESGIIQPEPGPGEPGADCYTPDGIETVWYTAESVPGLERLSLSGEVMPGYEKTEFIRAASLEEAKKSAAGNGSALILSFTETETALVIRGIVPEGTETDPDKALYLADTASQALPKLLLGADAPGQLTLAYRDLADQGESTPADPEQAMAEEVRGILGMVLPYLNIMIIYFLVLYYGQSVANAVILEKTSKLMDTFLVSVKPEAMIFGKVLAAWTAALLQVFIWLVSLVLGFGGGYLVARVLHPDAMPAVFRVLGLLRLASGLFSLPGILVALGLIVAGFLLYCCMAAIGASFASKPEELSAGISIFTITLVISMFVTLRAGFLEGEAAVGAKWFDFVPFTAMMITPSRALLGQVSPLVGLASLAVMILLSLVFIRFAGRAYKAMSLYKGNFPKPADIPKLLKG